MSVARAFVSRRAPHTRRTIDVIVQVISGIFLPRLICDVQFSVILEDNFCQQTPVLFLYRQPTVIFAGLQKSHDSGLDLCRTERYIINIKWDIYDIYCCFKLNL